ncbi:DUF2075 domain-containing protein [Saccharolobus solfataricus]|uniref:Schlafen group 3-like DNA/RNA helicase domain-containing protein n=2 Tax=Saccharolobus solfataricus TaxID=2287 RepID=Q97YJ0_SACS2|nr:DNA/RNA helicase domain-containing protein [Saccharolobus solfataricus]AAK41569.1 Conserved hypothetical protein [Saccharolobus solfataricus P2]QPG48969.1 DUF2075 domain-containing protein [Saccharolobus solfataricus]SAI84999.1 ATP/GTP-binding protein [Saccharolobus solfataricus]
MPLPVILHETTQVKDLVTAYRETFNEYPSVEQENTWRRLLDILKGLNISHPIIMEYPIFTERVDTIFVDKNRALVVEAKGWKKVERIDDLTIKADGELHLDPCYQLNNYVTKLNTFHSSSIKFDGTLFLYNTMDYSSSECEVLRNPNDLKKKLDNYSPGGIQDADKIVNGKFVLTKDFIKFVAEVKEHLKGNVAKAILPYGFGLTEEQGLILSKVLKALEDKDVKKNFLIRGGSGSGKSLLAVTIFLEAFSRGYFTILSYVNQRLLNTIRLLLGGSERKRKEGNIYRSKAQALSQFIMFYSTGYGFGVGEEKFPEWFKKTFERDVDDIDLIVFDEAQRMNVNVIKNSSRGRVNVYFYDDSQILLGDEEGTEETFKKYLTNVEEYQLSSSIRVPKDYIEAVKGLLEGRKVTVRGYDFRIFNDVMSMINELKKRKDEGRKVALICSFTESVGDKKNKTKWTLENIRIGYPLQSGFDLYKNTSLRVKWLMDEKTEYPKYWRGELDPLQYCASVYGAQGFEADYVGVVWGRDMIWRDSWTVNPDLTPITDYVGGRDSLKKVLKRHKTKALKLLKNRYYIMLTRGIRGVYLFFEDRQTGEKVDELVEVM